MDNISTEKFIQKETFIVYSWTYYHLPNPKQYLVIHDSYSMSLSTRVPRTETTPACRHVVISDDLVPTTLGHYSTQWWIRDANHVSSRFKWQFYHILIAMAGKIICDLMRLVSWAINAGHRYHGAFVWSLCFVKKSIHIPVLLVYSFG